MTNRSRFKTTLMAGLGSTDERLCADCGSVIAGRRNSAAAPHESAKRDSTGSQLVPAFRRK